MPQHTPGPWNASLCDDGAWIVHTEGDIVVVGDNLTREDAHLIAASPNLLATLRNAYVEVMNPGTTARNGGDMGAAILAVIATAEGRS